MANIPEGVAQFEYHRMQLISSLGTMAESMRNCANIADSFSQLVSQIPYGQQPVNGRYALPALPTPARGKRKAADDTDGRKTKRAKKPKDPNAPKRPASSYLLFQNEVRQRLKYDNPELPNNELLSLIAKMWKDMPKEQKDAYEARQKVAKEEWLVNRTAYQASMEAQEHTPSESPITEPLAAPPPPEPVASESSDHSTSEEEEDSDSDSSDSEKAPAPAKRPSKSSSHSEKKSKKKA
ncbi:hypothetical protein QCA50_001196 [Cerrena zonata]|uniref:HMG box domain-containing protein n=1 Tax=Cerrena zonata TaxID=2478898 RepID=A0AAW0GSF3_9APHY